MTDFNLRFGGIARLYGTNALERLRRAHILVVGLGGVGSWTVEALARSGIGQLTLVDLDEVCLSNINRQLPALEDTVGLSKADVLADRVRRIQPECQVHAVQDFFTAQTAHSLLGLDESIASSTPFLKRDSTPHVSSFPTASPLTNRPRPDLVIDAIDHPPNKVLLIERCQTHQIPLIVCGGAGGRQDATAVRIADLANVTHDRLLSDVRKRLRRDHGYSRSGKPFNIPCVYSPEPPSYPQADGTVCRDRPQTDPGKSLRLNCESGYGSAVFVTGTFGFAAAGHALHLLVQAQAKDQ